MGVIADTNAIVMTKRAWHQGERGPKDSIPVSDLLCWLSSVHIAQLEAGEGFDGDGWDFFIEWYLALSGT